ncbi:MAG: glycosyl transferase [Ignavibacteriaceae bacterium]
MYNFCTLFDSNYLTRGLALHESLMKHCPAFHLYIFAFDEKCLNVLKELSASGELQNCTLIPLKEFEDEKLLEVKPARSVAEYCWTSTSSTILYVLNNFNVESCTYLDADLYFYSSPEIIFREMGEKSILLTEHRYSPQYNKEIKSGKYCVQFVTFRNNPEGRNALEWWRDRCLEWCYARYEDGKFGDQLYLDDWTERFPGVHVLENRGGGLAAWNVQQYLFTENNGKITTDYPAGDKVFTPVFYHFHYLRFLSDGRIELGRRYLSESVLEIFYIPYIRRLLYFTSKIEIIDSTFDPNGTKETERNLKSLILFIYRKLRKTYNVFNINQLLRN